MVPEIKWIDLKEVAKLYPDISFDDALNKAKDIAKSRMWRTLYE